MQYQGSSSCKNSVVRFNGWMRRIETVTIADYSLGSVERPKPSRLTVVLVPGIGYPARQCQGSDLELGAGKEGNLSDRDRRRNKPKGTVRKKPPSLATVDFSPPGAPLRRAPNWRPRDGAREYRCGRKESRTKTWPRALIRCRP